jgi:putative FmdB family regulatory protein
MPTYEYRCEQCGYRFEVLQEMRAEQVGACPQCGGYTRRVFGRVGLIFKGSAAHSDDYPDTSSGLTCCGRTERCEVPPCSDDGACKR